MVLRKIPRGHQLFAQQNTADALRQLQSAGLGALVQSRKKQMTYHKPLPTADNKHAVETILAPNHTWDEYVSLFSKVATLTIRPTLFNALLLSSPFAARLKDTYNIGPASLDAP